jgi:hypothetical protein
MRIIERMLVLYRQYGKPYLPSSLRKHVSQSFEPLAKIQGHYDFWRVKPGVTRLLGPQFRRNRHRIGIAITYACNLRCHNCDESSAQAPADTQMSVEQIQTFADESAAARYRWDLIEIAGGEPTMHKDFLRILDILREYRDLHSPHTVIKVLTNGAGDKVKQVMAKIPADVLVLNSQKEGKRQIELKHATFNLAPDEIEKYQHSDFRNACEWTEKCGTGLGPTGYYHCPVAAGMDRIFGWNLGRTSLPSMEDSMEDLAQSFCQKCGYFLRHTEYKKALDKPLISPVWQHTYTEYRSRQANELVILQGGTGSTAVET